MFLLQTVQVSAAIKFLQCHICLDPLRHEADEQVSALFSYSHFNLCLQSALQTLQPPSKCQAFTSNLFLPVQNQTGGQSNLCPLTASAACVAISTRAASDQIFAVLHLFSEPKFDLDWRQTPRARSLGSGFLQCHTCCPDPLFLFLRPEADEEAFASCSHLHLLLMPVPMHAFKRMPKPAALFHFRHQIIYAEVAEILSMKITCTLFVSPPWCTASHKKEWLLHQRDHKNALSLRPYNLILYLTSPLVDTALPMFQKY